MTDPERLHEAGFMCVQIGPRMWYVRGQSGRREIFPDHKLLNNHGQLVPYDDAVAAVTALGLWPFEVDPPWQREAIREWKEGIADLTETVRLMAIRTLSPA